jgi:hypothetical protein
MTGGSYPIPTVTMLGPVCRETRGGHRYSLEGSMKQP